MIAAALFAALAGWLWFPQHRGDPPVLTWDDIVLGIHRAQRYWPGRNRRLVAARREWVANFAAQLSAGLRSGQPPASAWSRAWGGGPTGQDLATGVGDSATMATVMRRTGQTPGCSGLLRVAACWSVAEASGAQLAPGLDQVGQSLAAEQEIDEEIEAQLAGPRATTRLLLVLPAFALVLGRLLGADPLTILGHTGYGWACLLGGCLLLFAGWFWTRRQIRAVSSWVDAQ